MNQIRDERKEQIMGAALKVFARRGIIGTKISMIAEEAKISKGLTYHYFVSKDELFTALVQEAVAGSKAGIQQVLELPGSPLEKIRSLTEEILGEDGQLYFMLMHQARTSEEVPEEAKELIKQNAMVQYVNQLEPLFIAGQQAGEVAAGDPRKLISSYMTVLAGLMTLNIHGDDSYEMPDVDTILRMVTGQ